MTSKDVGIPSHVTSDQPITQPRMAAPERTYPFKSMAAKV